VDNSTSQFVNFLFSLFASFALVKGLQWVTIEMWDWHAAPIESRILLVVLTILFWAPWRKRNGTVKQEHNIQE
jgi:hypothetical protein